MAYQFFRPSSSKSNLFNLVRTLAYSMLFWLTLLYIVPNLIVDWEKANGVSGFNGPAWLGWGLLISFSLIGLASGYTMSWFGRGTPLPIDCPNELVVQGPYRYVRNPMAVAGIGQGIAVGLILGSWVVILYALAGALLWNYFVRPSEEADLVQRFGASFLEYQREVWCWWPRLTPYR